MCVACNVTLYPNSPAWWDKSGGALHPPNALILVLGWRFNAEPDCRKQVLERAVHRSSFQSYINTELQAECYALSLQGKGESCDVCPYLALG